MNNPVVVCHLDGLGQRADECGGPAAGKGGAGELLGEAPPFDKLHGEVRPALEVADVVYLHDVGVSQGRGGLGLAPETFPFIQAGKIAGQKHLESDRAVEALIPRPVHNTHAAPAQLVLHFVAAEIRRLSGPRPAGRRAGDRAGGRGK